MDKVEGEKKVQRLHGETSQSSPVVGSNSYCEVFLSSGEDTDEGFTSCLFAYFVEVGKVYAVNGHDKHREDSRYFLRRAIKHSIFFIPVFSKGYFSDKLCLYEFGEMVKGGLGSTGQTILPIFYDVTRADVENQIKRFEESFLNHWKQFDEDTFQIWKEALQEVVRSKGWELKADADGKQGILIKKVVLEVSEKLERRYLALSSNMTDYLVGMDHHVNAMTSLLDISQKDVRIVGICGPNGIGKTTIARVVYNQLSRLFEYCVFLEDIQTKYKDLVHLQNEPLIKDKIQNKKVLIVLDDIDQRSQLNAVAENLDRLGVGSRIIVTTTKKYVLPTDAAVAWIHEPLKMDSAESLQLLSKHAFRRNHPPKDYYELSNDIASLLVGIPSSIKIIGSFLFGKNTAVWAEVKKELTKSLKAEVKEKLKLNYKQLDYQQRQILLDIVCHFIGVDRRIAHYMWDDCGFYPGNGVEFLRILSMVIIGDDNMLRMDVEVKEEVERLCLTAENDYFPYDLPNLRYRHLEDLDKLLPNEDLDKLFPKLRWLRWLRVNGFPPELSWNSFCLQNLVILDLSWSKISDDWEGWNHIKVARKLKVLNLRGCVCLTTTPKFSDSVFPDLEGLILEDCQELADINSISSLKRLIFLNVKNCAKLEKLPDLSSVRVLREIILDGTAVLNVHPMRSNKRLRTLSVSYCRSLTEISFTNQLKSLLDVALNFAGISELPDSIGLLVNLQNLSLNYCSSLKKLPGSIGKLAALVELNLVAAGVTNLPEDIGMLKHLRVLNLASSLITELPASIGKLEKLQDLNVSSCSNFNGEIPSSIGKLFCLRILNFSGTRISNLPKSICELSRLQILILGCKTQISGSPGKPLLPDLIGSLVDLQYMSLSNQHSIPKSIWNLESLVELNLEKIEIVELPETIGLLRNLRKLNMKGCSSVQFPAELKFPCDLTDLTLLCTVTSLRSIGELTNLRRLCLFSLSDSSYLDIPSNINNCSKLEELTLMGLNINSLPNLPPSLLELRLENCAAVKALQGLSNLEKLEHLGIEDCTEVNEIEGLDKLKSLHVLRVIGCKSLKVLPDLSKCTKLLELNLRNCEKLRDIKGLDSLVSLEELDISFCKSLERLPKVPNINMLKVKNEGVEALTSSEKQKQSSAPIKKGLIISQQESSTPGEASSSFPTKRDIFTSVSSKPAGYDYEVFLSFRGQDTRKCFTDPLHLSLADAGIRAFKDNEKLHIGIPIGHEIPKAIEQSKILIPILSKSYASSKRCLEELSHMVKCMELSQQIILPIFYDVTPSDVKHQTGAFAEAFLQHEKVFPKEIIQEWKEALKKVTELKGFEKDKIPYGRDAELVKSVVSEVCNILKKSDVKEKRKLRDFDGLVGMDYHEQEMLNLLDINGNGFRIVGICGMSGIGKTTIAKYMYSLLSDHFQQRCSFLEDVGEKVKLHNGYNDLENQLVSDILKSEADGVTWNSRGIKEKPVLIVLDNVEERSQLNRIVRNCFRFGQGSRIIVTSRNRDVFEQREVEHIYQLKKMSFNDSLILFCRVAFKSAHPLEGYEDISKELVSSTAGLPLPLVVLGSLLFSKQKAVWEETMEKLRSTSPDLMLQQSLMISFEALSPSQQQIFLDIACHFNGQDKTLTCYMWEDCGFSPVEGIEVLASLSLITIKEDNTIQMHDLLRDLGRRIVRQEYPSDPGLRSRLWSHEEAADVLMNKLRSRPLTNDELEGLMNLRYLHLEGCKLGDDFMGLLPSLRWLRWRVKESTGFRRFIARLLTIFFFGGTSTDSKLVILDLSGSDITDGWESWIKIKRARSLKVLNLSYCLAIRKTPDFSTLVNLERLILKGCSSLTEISSSAMHLKRLIYFNASGCRILQKLPDSIGSLVKLQFLSLNGCESLLELPESFCDLTSLVDLDLSGTDITELPEGIGNLKNLRKLLLNNSRIQRLTDEIGMLVELENLELAGCMMISELPESIGNLSNLRTLNLRDNFSIRKLPDSITMLAKLENLEVAGCMMISELPESIGNLRNLRTLNLKDNHDLGKLPDSITMLAKLENLEVAGCEILSELPESIGNLSNLRTLNLRYNTSIRKLPDSITMLAKLENLEVAGCEILSELPESIGNLSNLRTLNLRYNTSIRELPDSITMLAKLENLEVAGCMMISELPESIGNLRNLRTLNLRDNFSIRKLPDSITMLAKLENLEVAGCEILSELPESIGNLSNLRTLNLRDNRYIRKLPDTIAMWAKLEELNCSLWGMDEFPYGISSLSRLRVLNLCHTDTHHISLDYMPKNLGWPIGFELPLSLTTLRIPLTAASLQSVTCLVNLRMLGLDRSYSSEPVDKSIDMSKLSNLRELELVGFNSLSLLSLNFHTLSQLNAVRIIKYRDRERLLNLSDMQMVRELSIKNCRDMIAIGYFGQLKCLEYLEIVHCNYLEKIPDVSGLKRLNTLRIHSCFELREIKGLEALSSLEYLEILDCGSLEEIPDVSGLKRLNTLRIHSCFNLREIKGLEALSSLECLELHRCPSLKHLPDLSNFKNRPVGAASGTSSSTNVR